MLRQSLKIIAAFWAVLFAAVAVAGDGIRLSEWGDAILPEQPVPAKAGIHRGDKWVPAFAGKESGGLGLGEFLVDEARSFGAGALDGEQLRKALANRAIGKDGAGIRYWMANRWESAPGRFGAHMAGYAEGRLESLSWVESADVRWTPSADDAFGAFSASGVGGLWTGADSFFGVQPKIRRDAGDGAMSGNFGIFQRKAFGDFAVAGVNAFVNYKDDPVYGEFARWSLGADFASPWVDGNAKRYFSNEGRKVRIGDSVFQAYVPDGVSAELRVHSPGLNWLEGYATFTKWEGRGPNPDTINRAYGVSFAPRAGWKVDAETTDGDDFGARVAYAWTIGTENALAGVEPFGVYTELTKESMQVDITTIHNFQLYETAALYELQDSGMGTLSAQELERRISLSWELVPLHLRITEEYRGKCVPPIFAVNNYVNSMIENTVEWAENNPGHGFYTDEDFVRKELAFEFIFAGDVDCFAFLGGMKETDINKYGHYPLHSAVRFGWNGGVDTVRLAILAGADVNVKYDPDLADERRFKYEGDENLEDFRDYTPVDFAQHRYSSYEVHTYDYWSGGYRRLTVSCDIVLGDWNDFHSATGLYSVRESWRENCLGFLKVGEILGMSGGHCEKFESGPVCRAADSQYVVNWKPKMPPNGDLLDETISEVMPGYVGEVFRVTATTAYADVDFTLFADSNALTIRRGGTIVAFNNSGANVPWYGLTHNTANGRINSGDETKVAIVELTKRVGFDVQVTATLEARFFYHVNELNTVTLAFTLSSKADPETISFSFVRRDYGNIHNLSTPGLVNERFKKTGGDDRIGIELGGAVTVFNANEQGATLTLFAESEADNLFGTMQFVVEAMIRYDRSAFFRNNSDFPNHPPVNMVDGYSGSLFTVTIHPPYSGLKIWDQTQTEAISLRFLAENIAEVLLTTTLTHPAQFTGHIVAESGTDHHGVVVLDKIFGVSTIPNPDPLSVKVTLNRAGMVHQFSGGGLSGDQFYNHNGGENLLSVSSGGEVRYTGAQLSSREFEITIRAAGAGYKGDLFHILKVRQGCVAPTKPGSDEFDYNEQDPNNPDAVYYELWQGLYHGRLDELCEKFEQGVNPNPIAGGKHYVQLAFTRIPAPANVAAAFDMAIVAGLEFDREVGNPNVFGRDRLIHAATRGGQSFLPAIRTMVTEGVQTNLRGANGETLLMIAAQRGNDEEELFDFILGESGAVVNFAQVDYPRNAARTAARPFGSCADNYVCSNRTALHFAAINGNDGRVQKLLDAGADASAEDVNYRTALSYAAQFGFVSVVAKLLPRDTLKDLRSTDGLAPIHYAALWERKGAVEALLTGLNAVNKHKFTNKSVVQWYSHPRLGRQSFTVEDNSTARDFVRCNRDLDQVFARYRVMRATTDGLGPNCEND